MYKLFLSLRYLRAKKVLIFAVAGVAVGVMALIVVLSVMEGFDRQLRGWIRGALSDLIVEGMSRYGVSDYKDTVSRILEIPHVKACSAYVETVALVRAAGASDWCMVRGIIPKEEAKATDFGKYLWGGKKPDFALAGAPVPDGGAICGVEFMNYFGLRVGDRIIVIGPRGEGEGGEFKPGYKSFTVVGVFKSGMYDHDLRTVYVPLEAAFSRAFLDTGGAVSGISVALDNPDNEKAVRDVLAREFPDYLVSNWQEKQQTLLRALLLERRVQAVITFFIVVVAGFNILALLTVIVLEKTREIGVIRALGATTGGVMSIFVGSGLAVGVFGAGIGTGLGIAFTKNINRISDAVYAVTRFRVFPPSLYYFDKIPAYLDPVQITAIAAAAVIVSLLASISPAVRAARMDPVEAIRYE